MRHPVLHNREKERTKKLLKFLRDFQDTRDKKKEFATNNVQHKVVYTTLRTRIQVLETLSCNQPTLSKLKVSWLQPGIDHKYLMVVDTV